MLLLWPYRSLPPYLIVNRCKDVVIHVRQAGLRILREGSTLDSAGDGGGGGGLAERSASKHTQRQVSGVKAPPDMAALPAGLADGGGGTAGVPWDVVEPNVDDPMPYAWDQPDGQHAVMVAAFVAGTAPAPDNAHVSDPCQYALRYKHFSHLLLYTSIQTVSCKHWRALHTITCP
jgi:hypothetical protein